MNDINNKFDFLYQTISDPSFLRREALGGEIPFFISPYEPEEELIWQENIHLLINKLINNGIEVLNLNLYDSVCEIIESKRGMKKMFAIEKGRNKDKFLKALQSSLNIHQVLMPYIQNKIEDNKAQVYFVTGVGSVFPFIRSHNVLNNLQSIIKNAPMVMFFPGEYNGQTLNLFGILKDDNYYRAYNIFNIETK